MLKQEDLSLCNVLKVNKTLSPIFIGNTCHNTIKNCTFKNNSADVMGGAIHYNKNPPISSDLIF